jgi:hypothetical protein
MSKSKFLSVVLFCVYVVLFLVDNSTIAIEDLIYACVGLICIWFGERIIPIRLRAGTHLFNWTVIGWGMLLLPIILNLMIR